MPNRLVIDIESGEQHEEELDPQEIGPAEVSPERQQQAQVQQVLSVFAAMLIDEMQAAQSPAGDMADPKLTEPLDKGTLVGSDTTTTDGLTGSELMTRVGTRLLNAAEMLLTDEGST